MHIRLMEIADLARVEEIYNQAIAAGKTADMIPLGPEKRLEWFHAHKPDEHPVYVGEMEGNVVAWLSFTPYRAGRAALRYIAEISCYVDDEYHSKGLGTIFTEFALEKGKECGFKNIFTIILDDNTKSIRLMEKLKFEKWAHLPRVAEFEGREAGHVYYGRRVAD